MHFFITKYFVYAGIAVMIFSGLTLSGTAVVLAVMMPVFVVLTPILVPAVITLSFLATGFLASGSLGASAITILVWLYKKEEHSKYTMHVREFRHERASKLPEGDKPVAEDKSPEKNKLAEELENPAEEDKSPERNKLAEESYKPPGNDMVAVTEEDKPRERDKSPERDKQAEEGKPAEELTSIPEISKVLLVEQNPIGPKCCGRSPSTKRSHQYRFAMDPTNKARSIFAKECQKVPRVGAFAYKYFTSRDKKYVNQIHI